MLIILLYSPPPLIPTYLFTHPFLSNEALDIHSISPTCILNIPPSTSTYCRTVTYQNYLSTYLPSYFSAYLLLLLNLPYRISVSYTLFNGNNVFFICLNMHQLTFILMCTQRAGNNVYWRVLFGTDET